MTGIFRQVFTADDPRGPWPARHVVKALEHLREWSASSDEWSEMCEVQCRVSDQPAGPDRDEARARMAELLESYADRMERSGLVRAFGPASVAELRAEAAEYRQGKDPHA